MTPCDLLARRDSRGAARRAYVCAHGPIPGGYDVHHTGENGACVNPEHLVALTPDDHKRAHGKVPGRDMKTVKYYLPGDVAEVLEAEAARLDVSTSEVVREGILLRVAWGQAIENGEPGVAGTFAAVEQLRRRLR